MLLIKGETMSEKSNDDIQIKEIFSSDQISIDPDEQVAYIYPILQNMLNAFVIFDSVFDDQGNFISYRFVYINEAYEQITDVKNDEVKGKTVHEVWPETEDSWIQKYGHVAMTGETLVFDNYHEPTKKLYHCRVYRPWETNKRFCVIFEDINEQRSKEIELQQKTEEIEAMNEELRAQNEKIQQAYEELLESEKKLNEAQRLASIGDFTWNVQTGEVTWSQGMYDLLGYDIDDKINLEKVNQKIHHPEDVDRVMEWLHGGMDKGLSKLTPNEYRLIRKNGETITVHAEGNIAYRDEKPYMIFGTCQDITKRLQAEDEIRKLSQFPIQNPNPVMRIAKNGKVMFSNNAGKLILKKWNIHENHLTGEPLENIKKALETEGPVTSVLALENKFFSLTYAHIPDSDLVNIYGLDITDLEKTSNELQQKTEEIEAMNEELRAQNEELEHMFLKIKESEEKFRSIFDNVSEGLIYADLKGSIIEVNNELCNIVDIEKDELIGKKAPTLAKKILHVKMIDPVVQKIGQLLKGKPIEPFEIEYNERILEINASVQKKSKRIIGIIRDVTELKKAEREIAEREQLLRFAVEQNPIPVIIANAPDVNILYHNNAAENLLVKPTNITEIKLEEQRENWPTFYPDGTPYKVEDLPLTRAIQKGDITKNTEIIVRHGDIDHWINVSAAPLRNEEGAIIAGIVTFPEITEQKEILKALEKAKQTAEDYLNISSEIIVAIDNNGTITLMNESGHKLLGYEKDELIGRNWFDTCLPENVRKEVKEVFDQIMRGKIENVQNHENIVITKIGEEKTILWHNTILKDDDGNIIGSLSSGEDITIRKEEEVALQNAIVQQQEAVKAGNVGLWDWDLKTNNVHYSKEWKRQIGYEEDEISDDFKEWQSRVHPDDLQPTLDRVNESIRLKRSTHEVEFRFRHKDGSYRWILAQASIILDENGDPAHMIGSHVDITEEKEAIKEIENIWNFSPDLLCVADYTTTTFIKINPSFTKTLGYSEEDLLNKSFLEFVHPDDKQKTIDVIEEELKLGNVVINFTNRNLCKDGSYRYLNWISRPDKETGLTYAIARDVTEQVQMQEKIKTGEKLLREIGKMAHVGGWELDAETQKVSWSEETYRIHEIPMDQEPPLGDAINFFHPDDRSILQEALQNALENGEPYDLTLRFISAKGKQLITHTMCQPIIENGKVVKLFGTFQDVTELKKAQEELRKHRDHLEEIVKERTDELKEQNKELQRMNKLFAGREFRIKELRDKVEELENKLDEE